MTCCGGPPSLHNVINQAIDDARALGLGERHQHQRAVEAAMGLNGDLTTQAAVRLVNAAMEVRD